MALNRNTSMLIDIQYTKGNKAKNQPDCLYTIYKDLTTGKKEVIPIENPKMPIYFEKDDCRNHTHNVDFREISDCEKVVVPYKEIPFAIANHMGDPGKNFLREIFETKNYRDMNMIYTYPYVFGHDYDIRVVNRYEWKKHVNPNIIPEINKGFLDIECDSFDIKGFANPNTCPIDLVTVIDGTEKKSYTFALVNKEYKPQVDLESIKKYHPEEYQKAFKKEEYRKKMYESRHKQEQELMGDLDGLREELHDMFDDSYGKFNYNFYFYEDEKKMLIHLFQMIHQISPDFLLIWNISFDIPYIIDRLKALGLNPEDIIPDPEFVQRHCYFKKDHTHHDIKNKTDFFEVTSKTIYIDQMELYGAVRKGREEQRSYSLNAIGKKEVEDEKLDYSEDGDIKTVGYRNYRKYFIYNIKDVLLQFGIERNVEDIDTLYMNTYDNITPYSDKLKLSLYKTSLTAGNFYRKIDIKLCA